MADEKRISLRVPVDVYENVVSMANRKHLSLNSYILQVLSNSQYLSDLEMRISHIEQQIGDLQRQKRKLE